MRPKRREKGKLFELPENFIGERDEQLLESFGAYLIERGLATRWHRRLEAGVNVSFEIFAGHSGNDLLYRIGRDHAHDMFYVADGRGERLDEGPLEHVMAVINRFARYRRGGDGPA